MGASLTLAHGLILPLVASAAIAAVLLAVVLLTLAAAEPQAVVVATAEGPFRWN